MSRYVIADTHFRHRKITSFRHGFGENVDAHDEILLDAINSTCNKKDSLLILGDVCFGTDYSILGRIRANVRVIAGNHDNIPRLLPYVSSVRAYELHEDIWLSHIPVSTFEFVPNGRAIGNIHGHLHDKSIPDSRYECVSVEQVLMPVKLNDVVNSVQMAGIPSK